MKQIDTPVYVVLVRYTQPIDAVMKHLAEHRKFVEEGYARGIFLLSGRGADGDPGIIIATGLTRKELAEAVKEDAFYRHSVAEYEIVEFHASRACDSLGVVFPESSHP
ncbi:YciI family protein [Neorhizobium sp. T7_12]|uniref:YciI family protein n=1 Tax=Neorhizobium sp. T7_12 TaxID=2093832 RepID=UPI000CF85970|nr:YciI family protein [Neorhizobium sp. T7_12]